jgi:hypothetical protein
MHKRAAEYVAPVIEPHRSALKVARQIKDVDGRANPCHDAGVMSTSIHPAVASAVRTNVPVRSAARIGDIAAARGAYRYKGIGNTIVQ